MLSDLRESGAIEQDADIVSFIYRPQYYQIEEWEDGSPCENEAEIIIAKHRNGSLDDVRLRFIGELAKFANKEQGSTMIMESKMNDSSGFGSSYGRSFRLPRSSYPGCGRRSVLSACSAHHCIAFFYYSFSRSNSCTPKSSCLWTKATNATTFAPMA